jgi:hypothetical protein
MHLRFKCRIECHRALQGNRRAAWVSVKLAIAQM